MKSLSTKHFWSSEVRLSYKITHILLGCLLFFTLFYIFYRSVLLASFSMVFCLIYIKAIDRRLINRRDQLVVQQFNQLLYSLSSALVAGRSVENAFIELEDDMQLLYPDKASFINSELRKINNQVKNGQSLEKSLIDFSNRLSNQDIKNFALVFSTCKRSGGDLVEVIKKTATIINNKIELEQEIKILIARKRFEAQLISLAPLVIIGLISWSAADYMNPLYGNPLGQIVMTTALVLILISALISNLIMNIKV